MSIPSPSLYLNFAAGRYIDPRISAARASVATYFGPRGTLRTAPANTLRLDCDPTTGESTGLRVEQASTNLLLYCRDLTNVAWTKTNASAALDQIGIDGVAASASKITASAANGTCIQAVTSASASRAGSAYVKRVTGGGVVEMTQDGGATWTPIVPTSVWTRVELATAIITDPALGFRLVTSGDAIAVDYAQLESEQFATSPILTTSAAATRAEELPVMAAIDDWFNAEQGTVLAEYTSVANSQDSFQRIAVGFGAQGAGSNVIRLGVGSMSAANIVIRAGGAFQAGPSVPVAAGTRTILVGSYATDRVFCAVGGVLSAIDAGATMPAITATMVLGCASAGVSRSALNGTLRRVIYWPRQLSTAEVQALSL